MSAEQAQLKQAIAHFENLRASLGDTAVDTAITALQKQLAALDNRVGDVITARLIGRDAELQQLFDAFYSSLEDHALRLVMITGEPGIGKSRLIDEFDQWLQRLPEVTTVLRAWSGRSLSELPYALVRALLAFGLQMSESESPARAQAKLEHACIAALGPDGVEKSHFIGQLIGFDVAESPYLQNISSDALQIRNRAFHYITQLLTALSPHHMTVVIFDDLHWADEGSLDFIEYLVREAQNAGLLLICTADSQFLERHPGWGAEAVGHVHLDLCALSEKDSRLLVKEILHLTKAPVSLCDGIVKRAEGNPFYIEELITMFDTDTVTFAEVAGDQRSYRQWNTVRVPPTLVEVLWVRLETLTLPERLVLEQAAIVGRVFWNSAVAGALEKVGESTNTWARSICVELQRRDLIVEQAGSVFQDEQEYCFRHGLLRDIVYAGIQPQSRALYHAQAAEWLIARSGDRVGEYAGMIAEHYEQAGALLLAAEWFSRAGKHAQETLSLETAIRLYRKALALLPDDTSYLRQRIDLCNDLGWLLGLQARFSESEDVFAIMRAAAETIADPLAEIRAWSRLCWSKGNSGDLHGAIDAVAHAEKLATTIDISSIEYVMVLYLKASTLLHVGQIEASVAVSEQAVALSTTLNAHSELASNLNLLAIAHQMLGHYAQADAYQKQALELLRALGDRIKVSMLLHNCGTNARDFGDYRRAIDLFEEAIGAAHELGSRLVEICALTGLAWSYVALREYDRAERALNRSFILAETSGLTKFVDSYYARVQLYLGQGRFEEALQAAQQTLDVSYQFEYPMEMGMAWRAMGMAMMYMPDYIGAATCFAESERIFRTLGAQGERARTLREWARYEYAKGDRERGEGLWQEARTLFHALGMIYEIECMGDRPEPVIFRENRRAASADTMQ